MKHIKYTFALLAACLAVAAVAAPQAGSPVFQMRLVVPEGPEAPRSGSVEKMTRTMTNTVNGQIHQEVLYVEKTVLLDENDLKHAKVVTSALQNQIEIEFELTAQGRKRFAEVTRKNIDKRLAIIIDGRLCSAPVIKCEISGGKGQITGNFTPQEARALSDKINAALKK